MSTNEDEVLTVKQVADELHVNDKRVRRWIQAGELIAIDLGRDYRIYRRDLNEFIRKRRTGKDPLD
jgi:excisionase family DNA binding protein